MNRKPDDPNNDPTQMAEYGYGGDGNYAEQGSYGQYREPTGRQPSWSEPPPPPWYLRPVALIGLGVLTAILIALLVWGMVRLVNKEPGPSTPSSTSVSATTSAPAEEPRPQPVAPDTPTDESPPPATTTESSTTAPPTTTTEHPTTTTPSTTAPPSTTTPPSTTAPPSTTTPPNTTTTSGAAQVPSAIVIPLPPGL